MSPSAALAIVVFGLLAVWVLGGLVARLGGLLLLGSGIAALALDPGGAALVAIACGVCLWLAGHWHYALRHHTCKSPLARHLFRR